MSKELKPCPFCGGKASLNYERIPGENKGFWAQVICNACHGRSGGTWAGSYSAAERIEVKAWNRRANNDEQPTAYNPDEVVQQLKDRSTLSRPVGWSKSYEIVTLEDAIEIVKAGGADA